MHIGWRNSSSLLLATFDRSPAAGHKGSLAESTTSFKERKKKILWQLYASGAAYSSLSFLCLFLFCIRSFLIYFFLSLYLHLSPSNYHLLFLCISFFSLSLCFFLSFFLFFYFSRFFSFSVSLYASPIYFFSISFISLSVFFCLSFYVFIFFISLYFSPSVSFTCWFSFSARTCCTR